MCKLILDQKVKLKQNFKDLIYHFEAEDKET